jgi:hypothetical protein
MTPLRIFIGYDAREPVAYHVLAHSILTRASIPVAITPLVQPQLRACELYQRDRDPLESTAFSLTRFLVPYLSGYEGWSLYLDCDMLCRADLRDLPLPINAAVAVCQHDYTPRTATKFFDQPQTTYPRKNWSSLMVFYGPDCRPLTPEYVNTATPAELHRLDWAPSVGALPLDWNWLVGEYAPNPLAKMLHYTLGGPWFPETRHCDHAKDWEAEYEAMTGRPYGE